MEKIIRNLKTDLTGDPEEETSKNVCETRVEVTAENSLGVMMDNMSDDGQHELSDSESTMSFEQDEKRITYYLDTAW